MSARAIAKKMKVSKNSVNKRLKMSFSNETKISEEYCEKRGFKKWVCRKYTKVVRDRIKTIYDQMVEEKRFFINDYTIHEVYRKKYGDDLKNEIPNRFYIQFVQKQLWLHKKRKKPFRDWLSKYMHYPETTINKLGYIMEWIDFIGPRYLQGDQTPYHFLSRRYIRPDTFGEVSIISAQTTEQTIEKLASDRELRPIPQVLKVDNDSAFGMLRSGKTKDCIWSFTKWLLTLWISPIYSVPREPWNNGNVEGQNSIFNKLFWQEILFDSPKHLRTEITRFNTEYKQYSDLTSTKDDDMKKLGVTEETITDFCTKNNIKKEQVSKKEFYDKLTKKDFKATKIYVLRKVVRVGEKQGGNEKGEIELLGNIITLDKKFINSIVLCTIDVKKDLLTIWQEVNGTLSIIKTKKYLVKNI